MLKRQKLLTAEEAINQAVKIIKNRFPKTKVFLYGSRARNNARVYSDIDIGILSSKKTTSLDLLNLQIELEKIHTVLDINVVDFLKTSEAFRTKVMNYAKEQ